MQQDECYIWTDKFQTLEHIYEICDWNPLFYRKVKHYSLMLTISYWYYERLKPEFV